MSPFLAGGEKHLSVGNGCSETEGEGRAGRLADPCTHQPSTFPLFFQRAFYSQPRLATSPPELKAGSSRAGPEQNSREPAGVDSAGAPRY